jgi:hypothetical protein
MEMMGYKNIEKYGKSSVEVVPVFVNSHTTSPHILSNHPTDSLCSTNRPGYPMVHEHDNLVDRNHEFGKM